MSPPLLQVQGLSIRLPAGADRTLAVEAVDLSLEAGRTLCVVGESGSGKSMVANAVMGLLPKPAVTPVAGRILMDAFENQKEIFAESGVAPKTVAFLHVNDTFGTAMQKGIGALHKKANMPYEIVETIAYDPKARDL